MKLKDINLVEYCPHCESNLGYYTKVYAYGWIQDNSLFERSFSGKRIKSNTAMYDSLRYGKENPTCYCIECEKPIGTIKNTNQ